MNDGFPALIFRRKDKNFIWVQINSGERKTFCIPAKRFFPEENTQEGFRVFREAMNHVIDGRLVKVKLHRAFTISEILEVK